MAKYQVKYACNHGSHTEQLFGKLKDRERKIEWLENNKVCPDCYKAKMQEQRQAEQLTAKVIFNAFSGGVWLAVTTGDTYTIKDQLKALGCRWKEYQDNADVLGVCPSKKAWSLYVAKSPEQEDFAELLQAAIDKLASAGVGLQDLDDTPLAYAVAAMLAN